MKKVWVRIDISSKLYLALMSNAWDICGSVVKLKWRHLRLSSEMQKNQGKVFISVWDINKIYIILK